jgi:type I restriction enzyme S subunit
MDTKALRQKILDLAIRGKLVTQDPNDEPASVLLERIRAEKQQMVKDGKLKAKDIKNDTVIFLGDDNLHYEKFPDGTVKCIEDEIPFELPEEWEWTRLESVFKLSSGKAIKVRQLEDDGEYPVYGGNGINGLYSMYNVESETIIIGRVGFYCGSVYKTTSKAWVTDNALIASITEPSFYQIDFLCNLLKYLDLGKTSVSTAQPVVSGKGIYPLLVPIPPLDEQKRIVTKLNDCVSIVDVLESDKSDLQTIIQLTKSKILDLAIRGKLVPQNPDDEPASVLLERIKAEKEELIKQGKIKRDKKESVIYKGDDNSYYLKMGNVTETLDDWRIDDIPDNWGVCCLGEVCDYGNCTNVDTKDIPETAWILDLEDIEKDTGKVLQKLTLKERNSASTKHLFHKGQVLYSKLRPYLNKVVLADDDGFCTSEILPLDFNGYILPEYAKCYMMSPTFLRYANHCSYGVKMPRLGTLDGKKAVLTVPPINEQKRIADKVSQLFSLLDSIAENIN